MRPLKLALALALASASVAVGSSALAADPPGSVNFSNSPGQDLKALALSPGRVTWVDGDPIGWPIYKQAASLEGGSIALGGGGVGTKLGLTSPKASGDSMVHAFTNMLYPGGASGTRTGWATETNIAYGPKHAYITAVTNGGRLSNGTSVFRSLNSPSAVVRVSGMRVLYENTTDQTTDRTWRLLDLRTGASTNLTSVLSIPLNPDRGKADLFGNSLIFTRADGAIWRKDLGGSGPSVKLVAGGSYASIRIFAWGDYVAWDRFDNSHHCAMRKVTDIGPSTTLTDCPQALTDAGAILRNAGTHAWTLRHYAGDVVDLPVPTDAKQVAVDGGRLAWIQANGVGRIAPLPSAPNTVPRYLGNAIAPATFKRGGASWTFDLVTTEPLAKCSVAIKKVNGPTIRTLACPVGLMPAGEILVHWNGKNGSGVTVPAGTYKWIVDAADAQFDDLVGTDGVSTGISGTIKVS